MPESLATCWAHVQTEVVPTQNHWDGDAPAGGKIINEAARKVQQPDGWGAVQYEPGEITACWGLSNGVQTQWNIVWDAKYSSHIYFSFPLLGLMAFGRMKQSHLPTRNMCSLQAPLSPANHSSISFVRNNRRQQREFCRRWRAGKGEAQTVLVGGITDSLNRGRIKIAQTDLQGRPLLSQWAQLLPIGLHASGALQ